VHAHTALTAAADFWEPPAGAFFLRTTWSQSCPLYDMAAFALGVKAGQGAEGNSARCWVRERGCFQVRWNMAA